MRGTHFAVVHQLQQRFKLLMELVNDMGECRSEISGEDLELMKEVTVQQIKRFYQALDGVLQGELSGEPELIQLREDLRKLVASAFDTEELIKHFGPRGATDLGMQLVQLEEDFKLKKVDSIVYFEQKRRILEDLQCHGSRLSEREKAFLARME